MTNKKLVIYADGTWNTPANIENKKVASTNVYEMFKRTKDDFTHAENNLIQVKYYNEGVGTHSLKDKYLGGFLGRGINENIKELYLFIVENYDVGDEIYLFGFSRGAYTVRSVAGLIRNCGILKKKYHQKVNRAFEIYRSRNIADHPNSKESIFFRESFCHEDKSEIKFMGVWDTVGSLGIPFQFFRFQNEYRFHDVQLSSIVKNAYQAISIDERRVFFKPSLWHKKPEDNQNELEQVWFYGVHSDVGGGYPDSKIQYIPLHYLQLKAEQHGLKFKMRYSESDLKEATLAHVHNSKDRWYYKMWPDYFRIIDNHNLDKLNWKQKLGSLYLRVLRLDNKQKISKFHTCEYIHISVYEKFKKEDAKRPVNLALAFKIFEKNKKIIDWNGKSLNN